MNCINVKTKIGNTVILTEYSFYEFSKITLFNFFMTPVHKIVQYFLLSFVFFYKEIIVENCICVSFKWNEFAELKIYKVAGIQ